MAYKATKSRKGISISGLHRRFQMAKPILIVPKHMRPGTSVLITTNITNTSEDALWTTAYHIQNGRLVPKIRLQKFPICVEFKYFHRILPAFP